MVDGARSWDSSSHDLKKEQRPYPAVQCRRGSSALAKVSRIVASGGQRHQLPAPKISNRATRPAANGSYLGGIPFGRGGLCVHKVCALRTIAIRGRGELRTCRRYSSFGSLAARGGRRIGFGRKRWRVSFYRASHDVRVPSVRLRRRHLPLLSRTRTSHRCSAPRRREPRP